MFTSVRGLPFAPTLETQRISSNHTETTKILEKECSVREYYATVRRLEGVLYGQNNVFWPTFFQNTIKSINMVSLTFEEDILFQDYSQL